MSEPNEGQQQAAEAFFKFLFTEDVGFIISGPAGVGKTFLMSHIIDQIIPEYHQACKLMGLEPMFDEVSMTATTNKAAEVLAVATQRPTGTIHSFLNLKVQDDYDTGKSTLIKTRNWMIHNRKILFIDECSMIDRDLFKVLMEGTHKCKIVFVGDHNQLAPVHEKISPVYNQGYPFFELTEPMRNNGQPALMEVCAQLRKTVETGEFEPIKVVPGVIDLMDETQLETEIDTHFMEQNKEARILAFTNQRTIMYNDHIRTVRKLPDAFTAGEYLINNSAIRLGKTQLSVEDEITIVSVDKYDKDEIVKDTFLDYMEVTLKTGIGEMLYGVKLPTDRKHFLELVAYFRRAKNWERYYHLKNTYPDLRQRDAATVHKSQGSTYDTVFIDLENISTCNAVNQTARMLYVAFSRAKTRVVLYGNLAEKYGGLTQ